MTRGPVRSLAVAGAVLGCCGRAHAVVATPVTVNFAAPLTYAGGVIAKMTDTGIGLHTSVYANSFDDAPVPGLIAAAGVQLLRYPGGSYSDIYHWSTHTGTEGYIANGAGFDNFIKVMDSAKTKGMVTVNYGSDQTGTRGGQPQEAAAWVAYANASPSIYGTASDIALGVDAGGTDWKTAGYWAKLRASTSAQYSTWAKADGVYNAANGFLAINHPTASRIDRWEIGNEIGGNGYSGIQWEYDLHAPYAGGDSSSNVGRKNNSLLSPAAYGANVKQFVTLMKAVDPTIKIGAGFDGSVLNSNANAADKAILQATGNALDFGIIHWYPSGSLPNVVNVGSGSLPTLVSNLRSSVNAFTSKGTNGLEIDLTEFGYSLDAVPRPQNALFVADGYVTGFENGVANMDYLEMSKSAFLNDGPETPGEAYYATQLVSKFAKVGDTFMTATEGDASLRVHAVKRPDGSVAIMFVNVATDATTGTTADRTITLNLSGITLGSGLASLYLFGVDNLVGTANATAPTLQTLPYNGSGTLTLTIPDQTIGTLLLAVPEPATATLLVGAAMTLTTRRRRHG